MARFKTVCLFLVAWLAAEIFWHMLLRPLAAHHSDSPIIQGLVPTT